MEKIDVTELIRRGGILRDVGGDSPEAVFANALRLMDLPDGITAEQVYNALCDREKVLSTAVGNGIALPHARNPVLKNEADQRIVVVYLKNPIDMKAPDERLVYAMFILLTCNSQVHLRVISALASLFRNVQFRKVLEGRADEKELFEMIDKID